MANEVPSVTDAEAQRKEEERKLEDAKKRVEEYERIKGKDNKSKNNINGLTVPVIEKDTKEHINWRLWEPQSFDDARKKDHYNVGVEQGVFDGPHYDIPIIIGDGSLEIERNEFLEKYKKQYDADIQYAEKHKQPENQQGQEEQPQAEPVVDKKEEQPQAEPVVGEQGNKAEEKEKIDIADKDVDFALRMVPTYVQDFMKVNGMLPEEHKRMNTRELKAYLTSAEFSKEQKELLTGYLKDREQRKAEFEAYTKDPTKQSMKEDYVKAAQVKAEREQSLKEAQEQLKAITTKALEEEAKKVIPTQAAVTKALNVKVEPINVSAPVVKVGKTEVTKNNGKKKEKDAIIVIEGDRTYTLTKEMVKEVRKKEGKDAFPSFKKMMKAAENGTLPSTVVKSCFVKAYQLETGLNLDAMDGNKLKDDIKKPVQISLPFKKGREM